MQCLSNKLNKYFSSGLREKWVYTTPQAMVCGRNTGIKWVWVPSLPLASYKLQNSFQDTPPTSKQGYFSTLFLRFWICNQTWVFVSSNMEKQQIRLSNSYSLRVSCVQAPLWSGVSSRDGRGDAHPYRLSGGERLKTASITNKLSAEQMMLGCFCTLTYKTNVWCCNFMFRTRLITNRNRVLWVCACACACDAFYLKRGGQRIKPWQTESLHQVVKHYAGQWGLCPDTQKLQAAWFKVPPSLSSTSHFHSNFSSQAGSQYLQILFPTIPPRKHSLSFSAYFVLTHILKCLANFHNLQTDKRSCTL